MAVTDARIAENLAGIRAQIRDAARQSGRDEADITLVAVTKYAPLEHVRALVRCGCRDLGESRPQDLWARSETLGDSSLRWHMIGHLQRNKIRRTLPILSLFHAGDSLRVLQAADEEAARLDTRLPTLLEVNVSGDSAKHGLKPDEVEGVLHQAAELAGLQIEGLMAMAGREGDWDAARRDFAALRELRDRLARNTPADVRLDQLSMGMSGDFTAAILEGATIVRVGSALFEGAELLPEGVEEK